MARLAVAWALVGILASSPLCASAQVGVLIPEGAEEPDPEMVALEEVDVEVWIDHLHAVVQTTQIFENCTERPLTGRYELSLGPDDRLRSLALWSRERRREAVVTVDRPGQGIFESTGQGMLDPGLLEAAGDDPLEASYAVRVDPIEPYGRVRIDVLVSRDLDLVDDEAWFVLPLSGRERAMPQARRLRVALDVGGAWPLRRVVLEPSDRFLIETPFRAGQTGFRAVLDQREAAMNTQIVIGLHLDRSAPSGQPFLPALLTFREPQRSLERPSMAGTPPTTDDRGYFLLRAPVQLRDDDRDDAEPRDVVIALDTSLSMRGEALERAVAAIEGMLGSFSPRDRFGVMTFNDSVQVFPPSGQLVSATEEHRREARRFFRSGYLSGGTDLLRALPAALERFQGSRAKGRAVVLITDGHPSLGSLETNAIAEAAQRANDALGGKRARISVLGVGASANQVLLERLAHDAQGSYVAVGSSDEIGPLLKRFIHEYESPTLDDIRLEAHAGDGVEAIYPTSSTPLHDGAAYLAVGRYRASTKAARFRLQGTSGATQLEHILTAPLPRQAPTRSWIARTWAQHRVADLLERIDADGERPEWVAEIVALAREHLMVTPYTSLITTARSLLRPREITPGDPVLTVRVDPSDRAVTALFPFGTIKALRPVEPGLFETRFLAPRHLADGRHEVELVITGHDGRQRLVRDHFVIDSHAPRPHIIPPSELVRAGERVTLRVRSDRDTRRLVASLRAPGHVGSRSSPVTELRWDSEELACVGDLLVDATVPTGVYDLVVVAEDHAHNVGSASIPLEVRGR